MRLKPRLFRKPRKGHWATKGLVGLCLFNEGSGNKVFDLSGNGNIGTFTGTPDWGAGFYGPQVRCDDDQYITFTNKATDYITDQFTVVWIGTPAQLTADLRRFFAGQYQVDTAGGYDWGLYIQSDYTVSFFTTTGGAVFSTTTSNLSVGVKSCIVGTYDGANLRIYFDGIEQASDAQTGNITSSYDFKLGHTWAAALTYADVKTDYLSIYNRVLSASKIALLYREPFCMFERDPIELWVGSVGAGAPPGTILPQITSAYMKVSA